MYFRTNWSVVGTTPFFQFRLRIWRSQNTWVQLYYVCAMDWSDEPYDSNMEEFGDPTHYILQIGPWDFKLGRSNQSGSA